MMSSKPNFFLFNFYNFNNFNQHSISIYREGLKKLYLNNKQHFKQKTQKTLRTVYFTNQPTEPSRHGGDRAVAIKLYHSKT